MSSHAESLSSDQMLFGSRNTLSDGPFVVIAFFFQLQVEDGFHACLAGVQEGDEVVSINGEPCVNLTLSQALALIESSINSLQLLLKRLLPFSIIF